MAEQPDPAGSEPDDFDRQLRDLTSGSTGAARFTELSAAERARQAPRRATGPTARKRASWRGSRKARQLREPATGSAGGHAWPGRKSRAGSSGARRPAARQPRGQRLRSAAKVTGVLIAFFALLYVLHVLGYGPQ